MRSLSASLTVALVAGGCVTYRSDATAECEQTDEPTLVDDASGHCFTLFEGARSWDSAQAWCEVSGGGHLATIGGPRTNLSVELLADGMRVWLGATDIAEEGVWMWIDGERVIYDNWSAGQPDNDSAGSPEDCLEMNYAGLGTWNDDSCARLKPFICERPARIPER